MRLILAAFAALIVFWTTPAFAWGDSGHRTVCEIAYRNLTPRARTEIAGLLPSSGQHRNIGWACTYADHPHVRGSEHYVNYQRSEMSPGPGCGVAAQCVLTAIDADLAIVANPSATAAARRRALMFLGHWVGDVHQPLHASYGDDRGGGRVNSRGLCSRGLHATWDTCILEYRQLGQNASLARVRGLAGTWDRDPAITPAMRASWRATPHWQWATESYAIGIQPWVSYCIMQQGACWYSTTNQTFVQGQARSVNIDRAYMDSAMPVIQRRVTQAGIRLAHLLNDALDLNYS